LTWGKVKLCDAYIVCHGEIIGPKILCASIRCRKGLIHKANGISTMKKCVEQHHVDLLLKYVKAKLKLMEEVDVEFQNEVELGRIL
jgi:hypothetical protein